jgi:hypothetical protein
MRAWVAAVVDVVVVLVFVVIGRASHEEGLGLAGFAGTAWPFLVGLGVGWGVTRAWRAPERVWPVGVGVWVVTWGVGMLLRAVSGQGTAVAFLVVAAVFLGIVLLGWRGTAVRVRQRA